MDENRIIEKALENLDVGPVLNEAYRDLLQPACREMGENLLTIAKAVGVAMSPLKGAIWGFEQIRDWLAVTLTERLSRVDPTEIETPPMYIAGPILVNLQFVRDIEELRQMY